jgi:hypothetical protein
MFADRMAFNPRLSVKLQLRPHLHLTLYLRLYLYLYLPQHLRLRFYSIYSLAFGQTYLQLQLTLIASLR